MKALVAMSGGVDSSVAAALMLDEGYDVVGVTLKQWEGPGGAMPTAGCCTVGDAEDARRAAAQLDIPYYVLDYVDEFRSAVVDPFGAEYMAGRTPNPCIECNRKVRFSALLERTERLGCDVLVTGHHARVLETDGVWTLLRGTDPAKDQSYVLSMLTQDELSRVEFPVGELTKKEVRRIAASMGMRSAHKPESMDICFVGQGDYRGFLKQNAPEVFTPGRIVDTRGEDLGTHDGIVSFTVGQRRGLGVAVGEPRFVVRIEPSESTVVVGSRDDLEVNSVELHEITWSNGHIGDGPMTAQFRAHGEPVAAELRGTSLMFDEAQHAVSPGQTVAFYKDEEVLGGGLICRTNL